MYNFNKKAQSRWKAGRSVSMRGRTDTRDANPNEQGGRAARTANAGQDCGSPMDGAILRAFVHGFRAI